MRGALSGTVTNLGQIKVDIKDGTGFYPAENGTVANRPVLVVPCQ